MEPKEMKELTLFENPEFGKVRVVEINGEGWLVGKDVAEVLGYSNPQDALRNHVEEEDKKMGEPNATPCVIDSMGRKQYPILINESGVYALVFGSKLPNAKKFKHWVTSEVLPSIRKTGGYGLDAKALWEKVSSPDGIMQICENWKKDREKLQLAEAQIEADKPKVIFANALTASKSTILVRDLAKMLKDNGVEIGEKRFYKWLREHGYICQQSTMPTQRAMELGLFEIDTHIIQRNGESLPMEKSTTRITTKGQEYFISKFLN